MSVPPYAHIGPYPYVGPEDILRVVLPGAEGYAVRDLAGLTAFGARDGEPYTYVVGLDGWLRLAPRRSEHVACAGGRAVLGAGEVSFRRAGRGWEVHEVSNQSTGYCPDPDCWPAVAAALDRAGVARPDAFTYALVFRRCERCREINVVREGVYVCVFCEDELPLLWNVAPRDPPGS
ncbi:hypothetical protein [Streptomyces sp. YKOK-I1]